MYAGLEDESDGTQESSCERGVRVHRKEGQVSKQAGADPNRQQVRRGVE
jgi:hypothetical protein